MVRHADLLEGERVLNEVIYECQRNREGIGHAKLDLEGRAWARALGLREWGQPGCKYPARPLAAADEVVSTKTADATCGKAYRSCPAHLLLQEMQSERLAIHR